MNKSVPVLIPAIAVAIAMALLVYFYRPVEFLPLSYGICLPSPDMWQIQPLVSWLINVLLIGLTTLIIYLLNKSYNFVRTTEPVLPSLFLIFSCSNPWSVQELNTSVFLCLINIVGIGIIFGSYDQRNATHQMFTIGVLWGIGSMFQYAFLPMIFVGLLWAGFMKVFRLKEILAFFGGIVCPFWIAYGFGIITFDDFHFPALVSLFDTTKDQTDIFFLLLGIGLATFSGFILWLMESFRLYAGNSRVNAMNLCITVLGGASVICMAVDYENFTSYTMTLYFTVAVQYANICALWHHISRPWLVTAIPSFLYILLFLGTMFL